MRLRKIKNASERLNKNEKYFISDAYAYKGKWGKCFNNDNPIHIEIGCGKGQFIFTLAQNNPNINYIAIEKYDSVLLRLSDKIFDLDIPNLKLLQVDAQNLSESFSEKEVDVIYLNFSDPWPKNCHAKRRLTHTTFLNVYDNILKDNGVIIQKTDNRKLFAYSLESFSQNGWLISNISLDLHNDDVENVLTEYEEKWSQKGPIYRLEARKNK